MACFTVPIAEAVITTVVQKTIEHREKKTGCKSNIRLAEKLSILNKMLWGGSALLLFEHIYHGEITPWFPFFTAMENSADTAAMLHEIATVGTAMAALVTAVWLLMMITAASCIKRKAPPEKKEEIGQ